MGSDRNETDWEKIVLRMIVRRNTNDACRLQNEGRIDVDGEFNVSFFISV